MPGVLALDLALSVGWAWGVAGQPMPEWGVWLLPEGTLGARLNAFENCLLDALDRFRPDSIWVERPIPQRDNNVGTAELTYSMHGAVALVAHQHGLPWHRPSVGQIRNAVCGRSKLTDAERAVRPRLQTKATIVNPWIEAVGWSAINHADAKDAAAVWAYACGLRAARPPRKSTKKQRGVSDATLSAESLPVL